jgi:hypothetical protein
MIIVNESGMYSLLLTSRKPIAKKFKRWLTCEVLLDPPARVLPATARNRTASPQPIEDRYPGTRASRFLEELCRVYAFDDPAKLTKAFSIPKQALVWMQSMGSGEDKYLKRLAPAMAIAGCDMRYIEYGTRTYTREERTLIAELRQLPDSLRALAFYRLGQSMEQLPIAEEREDT